MKPPTKEKPTTFESMIKIILESVINAAEAAETPGSKGYAAVHGWDQGSGGAAFTVIVISGEHHDLADEFLTEKLPGAQSVVAS